jgi:bacteriophage N4 adsorption protein B
MLASVASAYYSGLVLATVFLASAILLLSIDDLFVDAWFWCRELYRRLTVWRVHRPLTANQLYERDEQPLAIMIPAWLEQAVIAPMIENMVMTLDYKNYLIFVGTYVNDPATIAEVERMRRRFRQLIRVEVPHAGPTCKADCLNWIVQAIFLHEQTSDIEFAGMVLHDGEDVLHPLELKLFNYILPRKDFIQIPVTSLERRWDELVAGTYMDEFAEWHARDLVVRESLSRMVPSAGVGTCFSRRALITLVRETNNQPFNTDSLTEDYDVGARLAQRGMQSIFCRFPVIFRVQRQKSFGFSPKKEIRLRMALCVREYFPDTFRAAYRQKARWILGICFQGWQQVGWSGSLAVKYLLFRDRKGIVTPFINIAAYILTAQLLAFYVAAYTGWWPSSLPDRLLDWRIVLLFYANGAMFLWRISQRCYFVSRLYGWEHGLLSIPRIVIGNLVNFMAASRAWKIFLSHVLFGSRIVWDKTDHDFPSADILVQRRRRLGELLVAWRAVDEDSLAMALHRQQSNGLPLGRMLIADGLLDEETVAEAIAYQSNLPRAHPTTEQIREAMGTLSIDTCVRWRIAPIGIDPAGRVMLATAGPPTTAMRQGVAKSLSQEPSWHVVRESEIAGALRVMRPNETVTGTDAVPLLGDLLLRMGLVRRDALDPVLSHYQPEEDGRIGDFLVAQGVVTRDAIEQAMEAQQRLLATART